MTTPAAASIASGAHRVVPVVVLDDAADAVPLGRALEAGGIRAVEVTLRTPAGLAAIARLVEDGRLLVGAGTVTTPDELAAAADAGARFVVSPGFDPALVDAAQRLALEALPGVATPSEVQAAGRAGLTVVKVFPVALLGGVAYLDALGGPFPGMSFFPSGGIGRHETGAYLRHPAVRAVGATWVAPRDLVAAGAFDAIAERAAEAAHA